MNLNLLIVYATRAAVAYAVALTVAYIIMYGPDNDRLLMAADTLNKYINNIKHLVSVSLKGRGIKV